MEFLVETPLCNSKLKLIFLILDLLSYLLRKSCTITNIDWGLNVINRIFQKCLSIINPLNASVALI